jgi:predicted ribonuclease YlaK
VDNNNQLTEGTAMAKRRSQEEQQNLQMITNNIDAINRGPQKKKWTKHDLRNVQPLTENQQAMFRQYYQGDQLCVYGSAGTGKSFLSLYLAMCDIIDPNRPQNRLILIRSAVPTRDLGFMPGTYEEKTRMYEVAYVDLFAELFNRVSTYDDLKTAGLVRFMTTSYLRGLTWDNSIIVVDECQDMTYHELNTVMTRVGRNSRVLFAGDHAQNDLHSKKNGDRSGIERFLRTIKLMPEFTTVQFGPQDIVRSDLVRSWIIASEQTRD